MKPNHAQLTSRFFNTVTANGHIVTKSSTDKAKIKQEYSFYYLLPPELQSWMVKPFNYTETAKHASYQMQQIPHSDLSYYYTHNQIDPKLLDEILENAFSFFNLRTSKKTTKPTYQLNAANLYTDKVNQRISLFKDSSTYQNIAPLLASHTKYNHIDHIVEHYHQLYKTIFNQANHNHISVISHGDPCLSNMFYSSTHKNLQFIDPKGALNQDALYLDPYYDIAKLSHSICGNYDYINSGLFSIEQDDNSNLKLIIKANNTDQSISLFKKHLSANNYDYNLIRLLETSLFLSMLPLHAENQSKVLGFILNAINIMEEIETNV